MSLAAATTTAQGGARDGFRDLLAAGWVLSLYSYLSVYAAEFWWPVQALHFVAAGLGGAMLVALNPRSRWLAPEPFLLWLAAYVAVTAAWFVAVDVVALQPLAPRVVGVAVLLGVYVALRGCGPAVEMTRRLLLLAVLLAVAANVYNAARPFAFLPLDHVSATPGRASGFYMNPNVAGGAILAALILAIRRLPPGWRLPMLVAGGVGIAVTVSRSSLLGWMLLWIACGWWRVVPRATQVVASLALGLAVVAGFALASEYLGLLVGIDLGDVLERLDWFSNPGGVRDASQASREEIAAAAWEAFGEHPFAGSGLGHTDVWSHGFSTHNMFLRQMVEQGVTGAVIFLALVAVIAWNPPARYRFECRGFAVFLGYWAFFSHNILEEYTLTIAIALAAAMAAMPEESACASPS